MGLVFFPNNRAMQDKIASIKASFRAAALWTGDMGSSQASENDVRYKPAAVLRVVPSTSQQAATQENEAQNAPTRKPGFKASA